MSLHLLRTRTAEAPPRDVLVQTGWGEQDGCFYLLIRELPEGPAGLPGKVIFTSSSHRAARAAGREYSRFLGVLNEMAIKLPSEMLSEVILDSQGAACQRTVTWLTNGERAVAEGFAEPVAEAS